MHESLNEHQHAARLYERALEARKITDGEESMSNARCKFMAAGAYMGLGDYLNEAFMTISMEHGVEKK